MEEKRNFSFDNLRSEEYSTDKKCVATGSTGCPGWIGACGNAGEDGECGYKIPTEEEAKIIRESLKR